MDAEHLDLFAAIGPVAATGVTRRIVDVRFHGTVVARSNVDNAFADGQDLDAQFVAGYAG